jgi:hypothetical protein
VINLRINGVHFGAFVERNEWIKEETIRSLEVMIERLNPSHVILPVVAYQETIISTDIDYSSPRTVSEQEVIELIDFVHNKGLEVILKPMVNVLDGIWRAHISFFDFDVPTEPTWADWFRSYTDFQLRFAQIAEEKNIDIFIIGCEMVQANKRDSEWRTLIDEVRKIYSGLVTYNCDKYQEDKVKWWDACDIISSSGYYPHDDWEKQLQRIEKVVKHFDKAFFFAETGCMNIKGARYAPNKWNKTESRSDDDQAIFYHSMFEACDKFKFVQGHGIWEWPTSLTLAKKVGFCPYKKKAGNIIKRYFLKTSTSK